MAKRKGQVVAATLVTPNTLITFPIVDNNDIGGGRHIYESISERNAIPPLHRKAGMTVYVGGAIKKEYILKPGFPTSGNTTDNNWEEYKPGVDPNTLTEHQKLEDIQYRNPQDGCSKLTEKIAQLESEINKRLLEHQKVENMMWKDASENTPGYPTLKQYLEWLEQQTADAAEEQYIDSPIRWQSKPSSSSYYCGLNHKDNLSDELIQIYTYLNNPQYIKVDDNGSKISLVDKLDKLTKFRPTVEEINNNAGTPLTSLLTVYEDPSNIIWSPGVNLRTKITQLTNGLNDVTVETIKWNTAPSTPAGINTNGTNTSLSENLINIFTKLADMNKEDKIIVTDTGTAMDLNTRLKMIQSSVTTASQPQTVEEVDWKTTQAGHSSKLSDNLIEIWSTLDDMNDPDKISIPAAATGKTAADSLTHIITDIYNKFTTITVEDINWKTTPSTPSGIAGALKDNIIDLYNQIAAINTTVSSINQNIEETNYGTGEKPSTTYAMASIVLSRKDNLRDELNQIYDYLNKADQIAVPGPSGGTSVPLSTYISNLNTTIQNLTNSSTATTQNTTNITKIVNGEAPFATPQYLLFTINEFEGAGNYPFTSQEYLTAWKCKIADITAYVNYGANIVGDIQTKLEICEPGQTDYQVKNETATTINTSSGTIVSAGASLNDLATINANSRIRVRVVSADAANTIAVYGLRVKLVCAE